MGSCLTDSECHDWEAELLDYYFNILGTALISEKHTLNFSELEREWRYMYPIAWADFTRFLLGWMPTHRKLNRYSDALLERALRVIEEKRGNI